MAVQRALVEPLGSAVLSGPAERRILVQRRVRTRLIVISARSEAMPDTGPVLARLRRLRRCNDCPLVEELLPRLRITEPAFLHNSRMSGARTALTLSMWRVGLLSDRAQSWLVAMVVSVSIAILELVKATWTPKHSLSLFGFWACRATSSSKHAI